MTVLLVPEIYPGRGSGHLRRCLKLLEQIRDATLYLPESTSIVESVSEQIPSDRIIDRLGDSYDKIVVDRFEIGIDEAVALCERGMTIGIDAGGPGRAHLHYLIDTLPRTDGEAPNLAGPQFLDLPGPAPEPGERDGILVTFGGEDPAELTERTAWELARIGRLTVATIVRPGARQLGAMPPGAIIIDPQASLVELLRGSRTVLTSFGLTAYEARSTGAAVVTVNPTPYHETLARRAGFESGGRGAAGARRAVSLVNSVHAATPDAAASSGASRLSDQVKALHIPDRRSCPVHPAEYGRAIWRGSEKSYFVCPRCGMVYLARFAEDSEDYSEEYFMEEYRTQYGRTYLDDFEHIASMGRRRLDEILRVAGSPPQSILDIGCAYGPFLREARTAGIEPFGIDIAPEAIAYVTDELAVPAVAGDFRTTDFSKALGRTQFDAVTLWYVIEHFPDLDRVLSRLRTLVAPGGVLAFSTPHGRGVSGRRNRDSFLSESPRDHFSIWDTASARAVLSEYGFRLAKRVITGHHPERYPVLGTTTAGRAIARAHSLLAGWGDTFEVYAVREEQ